MKRKVAVYTALFAALLFSATPVFADRLRGPVVAETVIDSPEEATMSLVSHDIGVILLESDRRICRGIEIGIQIPRTVAQYGNAFIFTLYGRVRPEPSATRMEYDSEKSSSLRLSADSSLGYFISFDGSTSGATEKISSFSFEDAPLLLTIDPMSKALPDSLASESFRVSVRGVFENAGILEIVIEPGDEDLPPFEIFIDDVETTYDSAGYVLDPGAHRLHVRAEPDFELTKNIFIERGRTEQAYVVFHSTRPTVRIDAPEDALIYLDGQRYRPDLHHTVEITAGEHIVLIQLGDYAISKRFSVVEGRDYTISLYLDIIVDEQR